MNKIELKIGDCRELMNNQNLQYFMKEGEGENEIDDYENNRKGMQMFNKQHGH